MLLQLNFLDKFDAFFEDFAAAAEKPIELIAKTPTKAVKIIFFVDFITLTLFSSIYFLLYAQTPKNETYKFCLRIAQTVSILK